MGFPASGRKYQTLHVDIYEFEGNQIKRIKTYDDGVTHLVGMGAMAAPELPALVPSAPLPDPVPTALSPAEQATQMAAVWNTHDLASYSKYLKKEANIMVVALGIPLDRDGFIASQEVYFQALPDVHLDILRRFDFDNGWIVEEHLYTAHQMGPYFGVPPSARAVAQKGAIVYHFQDGLADYQYMYFDNLSVLVQFGVIPSTVPPSLPPVPEGLVTDVIASPSLQGNLLNDPWVRNLIIYLPPSYANGGRFPVVYLLHGYGGNEGAYLLKNHPYWLEEPDFPENGFAGMINDLITSGEMKEMIIVMPDGSNKYGGSFYTNSPLIGNYEDYIVQDVVPYIDAKYRTIANRDSRAIVGHSMGSYGAMKLTMKHPDVFGAVASLSPLLVFEILKGLIPAVCAENPAGLTGPSLDKPFTCMTYALSAAMTPNLQNPPFFVDLPFEYPSGRVNRNVWNRLLQNDPSTMLKSYSGNLASLRGIYFNCGTEDEFGFYYHTQAFHQSLNFRSIAHEYQTYSGRHYTNVFASLKKSLAFLSRNLLAEGPAANPDSLMQVHATLNAGMNAHNVEQVIAQGTDDIVFDYVPIPPRLHGQDAMGAMIQSLFTAFPDFLITPVKDFVAGNILVDEGLVTGTQQGTWAGIPPTGKKMQIQKLSVFEFEENKITRMTTYHDSSSLMIQLGIMPAPTLPSLVPSFPLPAPVATNLSPLQAVRETQSRWNRHDLNSNVLMEHPDESVFVAVLGTSLNREQWTALQELYFKSYPTLHVRAVRNIDLGDGWVLCECVWNGSMEGDYVGIPATGRPISIKGAILYHFDAQGLLTEMHVYYDEISNLMQSGVIAPPGPPPAPAIPDRLIVDFITSPSLAGNLLGDPATKEMLVYLPPSYQNSPNQAYPVVYLLHGFLGDHTYFTAPGVNALVQAVGNMDLGMEISFLADTLIANQEINEMIIVLPNAMNKYGGSWYENNPVIGNYRSYIAQDLVAYIDGKYRTKADRQNRGIAGHSMGGCGALSLAMEYPNTFGAVAALSPGNPNDIDIQPTYYEVFFKNSPGSLRSPVPILTRADQWTVFFNSFDVNMFYSLAAAYSPNAENQPFLVDLPVQYPGKTVLPEIWQKWKEHDLIHQIARNGENLQNTAIFIDLGVGPVLLMEEVTGVDKVLEALKVKNVPYTYEEFFGDHLTHIREQIAHGLKFISDSFAKTTEIPGWSVHH